MFSLEALRQAAQTTPAVLVDSVTLLQLLDAVEKSKAKPRREPRPIDPEDERCARWLSDHLMKTKPNAKKPTISAWAGDVRMMRELDGRTHKQICSLFAWARADSFWHQNILCPKKLREKWDQLELKRGSVSATSVRETVEDRNARLRAAFLGVQAAPDCLLLEA